MPKENNKVDINKHEIDIDTLFKQNVNDLSSIKELYRKLKEVEEKISQIKYIDSQLTNRLKKDFENLKKDYESLKKAISEDYESLKCIILDENVQAKLATDIKTINSQLDTIETKTKNILYVDNYKKNGITDSEAIDRCLKIATLNDIVMFSNRNYTINKTISIPYRINVDFNNCSISPSNPEIFNEKYMIELGKTSKPFVDNDVYKMQYEIKNLSIIVPSSDYIINGIFCSENYVIKNIYTWGLDKTITVDTLKYLDHITIDNILVWGKKGESYAISTGYLGDAVEVSNIHINVASVSKREYLKSVMTGKGHNSIHMKNIINGDIYVRNSSNVSINGVHLEKGQIILEGAFATIKNATIWREVDKYAIETRDKYDSTTISKIKIEALKVIYRGRFDYTGLSTGDILLSRRTDLTLDKSYKTMQEQSIEIDSPTALDIDGIDNKYNVLKLAISKNINTLNTNTVLNNSEEVVLRYATDGSTISRLDYSNEGIWRNDTNSYGYRVHYIIDEERKIGRVDNTTLNKELIKGKVCCKISLNGYRYNTAITRIYRKPATDDDWITYYDVGVNYDYVIDDGITCNGVVAKNGLITELNDYSKCVYNTLTGNIKCYGNNIPKVGTWKRGDIIINTEPTYGTQYGWICVADGAPGSWRAFAPINS